MRLDRKKIIIIAGALLVTAAAYFLIAPLLSKVRAVVAEAKAVEKEMVAARKALQLKGKFRQTGELLTRRKVSHAIDEITKAGTLHNINFLSISPQKVVQPKGSRYPVLPIRMDLESDYNDLGLFLGAFERFERSIVAVKSFQIDIDESVLPQIETNLIVEVYLKEGEDG